MRVRLLAGLAGATLMLAGCGGGGDDPGNGMGPTAPSTTIDATGAAATPAAQADCADITKEDAATFAVWAQLFAQVRTVEAMQSMTALGYTPEDMAAILTKFEVAKGVAGEVYGEPDAALVVFQNANDTYAAAIVKGDAATDADLATLDGLEPNVTAWITDQATVLDALTQACPELGS